MDVAQITALIGAAASLLCTFVVGALTYFAKKTLSSLEESDRKNAEKIAKVEEKAAREIARVYEKVADQIAKADEKAAREIAQVVKELNDLKADLPLIYVTREDYIRVMNRVEDKLDQLLYSNCNKGKEE